MLGSATVFAQVKQSPMTLIKGFNRIGRWPSPLPARWRLSGWFAESRYFTPRGWAAAWPILLSVLSHLLLLWLFASAQWSAPSGAVPPVTAPAPLTVVTLSQWPPATTEAAKPAPAAEKASQPPAQFQAKQAPAAPKAQTVAAPSTATNSAATKSSATNSAVAAKTATPETAAPNPAVPPPATSTAPATEPTAVTTAVASAAVPTLNTAQILQRAAELTQQRPLSQTELTALQQKTWPEPNRAASDLSQATHVPKDVLAVFDDGSQLVKAGPDTCAIAQAGADLRRDIHSIKVVDCANSMDDYFQQVMSKRRSGQ